MTLYQYLVEGGMPLPTGERVPTEEQQIKDYVSSLKSQVKAWTETARQHAKNESFYRDIINKIGAHFGDAAKRSDDGSLQEDVLALKVEPLVAQLRERIHAYEEAVAKLPQVYQDDVIDNLAKG